MKDKILNEIATIQRSGIDSLLKWLKESDFFEAPASTEYHLSVKGGLAVHSWNVYEALKSVNLAHGLNLSSDTMAICGLLHDICKANFYKLGSKNVKDEATGKWSAVPVYRVDDQDPLGHGEKSVIILQCLTRLTSEECLAIRWHMGAWDAEGFGQRRTLGNALNKCPLLKALMLADQTATYFMEDKCLPLNK